MRSGSAKIVGMRILEDDFPYICGGILPVLRTFGKFRVMKSEKLSIKDKLFFKEYVLLVT